MKFQLNEPLPNLVDRQFKRARQTDSLIFSDTELTTIRTSTGVPFQIRYCPALAKKPKQNNDKAASKEKKSDPFADPHADLFIADIPSTNDASHILVLNKYPVIQGHFILATKLDKPQTDVLEQDDLEAAYSCLKEWESHGGRGRLFAFFNSGEHSGASQAHRHLQFLPVDSMRQGDEDGDWDVLADTVAKRPYTSLPFTYFSKSLPSDAGAEQLYKTYTGLLAEAVLAAQKYSTKHPGELVMSKSMGNPPPAPISYNMAMTTNSMVIVPRRSEGTSLHKSETEDIGFVALNGTTLGGTLMVKLQEEWDALRGNTDVLDRLLEHIGIPVHSDHQGDVNGRP